MKLLRKNEMKNEMRPFVLGVVVVKMLFGEDIGHLKSGHGGRDHVYFFRLILFNAVCLVKVPICLVGCKPILR